MCDGVCGDGDVCVPSSLTLSLSSHHGAIARVADVFILQSGCGDISVNDSCMELFILCQACATASAGNVTAVLPYFPYSKQSKQKRRGTIVAKLIADLLQIAGVKRVICLDLHHMHVTLLPAMSVHGAWLNPCRRRCCRCALAGRCRGSLACLLTMSSAARWWQITSATRQGYGRGLGQPCKGTRHDFIVLEVNTAGAFADSWRSVLCHCRQERRGIQAVSRVGAMRRRRW